MPQYERITLTPITISDTSGSLGEPVERRGRPISVRAVLKYVGGSELVDDQVVLNTADAEFVVRLTAEVRDCTPKWKLEDSRGRDWEIIRALPRTKPDTYIGNTELVIRAKENR